MPELTCLAIGKYAGIISFKWIVQYISPKAFINIILACKNKHNMIRIIQNKAVMYIIKTTTTNSLPDKGKYF